MAKGVLGRMKITLPAFLTIVFVCLLAVCTPGDKMLAAKASVEVSADPAGIFHKALVQFNQSVERIIVANTIPHIAPHDTISQSISVESKQKSSKKNAVALVEKARQMGFVLRQDNDALVFVPKPHKGEVAFGCTLTIHPKSITMENGSPCYTAQHQPSMDYWFGAAPDGQADDFYFSTNGKGRVVFWDITPAHYDFILFVLANLAKSPKENPFAPAVLPGKLSAYTNSQGWSWSSMMMAYIPGFDSGSGGPHAPGLCFARTDGSELHVIFLKGYWKVSSYPQNGPGVFGTKTFTTANDGNNYGCDFLTNSFTFSSGQSQALRKLLQGDYSDLEVPADPLAPRW